MGMREKIIEFRTNYPVLASELNLATINWNIFAIIFFIGVPFFLFLIQYLIITGIIPFWVAYSFFVLRFNDPNFASMFLSNYVHSVFDLNHIFQNALSSILVFLMIYLYFLFMLPYVRFRIPAFRFRFNPNAFVLTLVVILCCLPFSISGISIYFGKILGKTIGWGYSGLLYAFLGYFCYLVIGLLISLTLQRATGTIPASGTAGTGSLPPDAGQEEQGDGSAFLTAFIIFACVIIPFIVIAFILSELIQPGTGVFSHLGGFMLGFLVAALIELLTLSRHRQQKTAFGLILALVVVIPALFWLLFA